ncbi:cysteine hydrolase family protein [Thalassobacillus sp. CUG 92003]|uniref:cysteine hydrolase family protein n=1 Tax=Thalassobacillus sp. CUG 92003 TaxID=2736641 RepID=UPI0015E660D2|nr:isochorismatase family cysteine hydrolase [Thalassobacillus sp. CUG 92003]
MKKALITIDYTRDFVADEGALTCGEPGQSIETELVQLTRSFIQSGDFVVFAIDLHEEHDRFHPETALFPRHNIRGTKGRDLYGELQTVLEENVHQDHVYQLDKTRYSAFAGTDLLLKLRERGIEELHLSGVCTDICVLHTAIDAYNIGFKLVIHEQAVASFNPTGHAWALDHFKTALGVTIH